MHWLLQLEAIVATLSRHPIVALQIRNKYHPNSWNIVASHIEKWSHTHPAQCFVNGSIFPEITCNRHLPEAQIGTYLTIQDRLMGASIHSLSALRNALNAGSSYVQYGAIFPTSKPVNPVGIKALQTICARSSIPVLAVGGISNVQRVQKCLSAGAYGVSVGSWVLQSKEPVLVIEQIIEEIVRFMSNPQ